MAEIDVDKIDRINRYHDTEVNPSNQDNRPISFYDESLSLCSGIESIDQLLATTNPQENELKWIDYCCGRGVAVKEGTRRFNSGERILSSIGVDIRKFRQSNYSSVPEFITGKTTFYQHDLDQGTIDAASPDLITCIGGLIYIKDPALGLQGMFRQLKAGGHLLVSLDTDFEVNYLQMK